MKDANFDDSLKHLQLELALDWDFIETSLCNEKLWGFVFNSNNPRGYDTRIEYLFDLQTKRPQDAAHCYAFTMLASKECENRRVL